MWYNKDGDSMNIIDRIRIKSNPNIIDKNYYNEEKLKEICYETER